MTENDAIIKHIEENNNRIENIKFFMSSNRNANIDDCKRNIEILTISNKALEKQIPKMPIQKNDANFKEGKCFYCPNCKESLATNEDDTYYNWWLAHCDNCGQTIDWSDMK